ncbi:hypothetical protein MASR1M31_03430 [Porphyromonadaceae bacterium]
MNSSIESVVRSIIEGNEVSLQDEKLIKTKCQLANITDDGELDQNPFDQYSENSIAILPISGLMVRYSYWRYGCDFIASLIRLANKSPKIIGILLLVDSSGGSINSVIHLEEALKERSKKCITLIEGTCASACLWVASYSDEIWAMMNPICDIGSIGNVQICRFY